MELKHTKLKLTSAEIILAEEILKMSITAFLMLITLYCIPPWFASELVSGAN
jgi:hypothetical protein